MAFYVLLCLSDGRPTFMLDEDEGPQACDSKDEADELAGQTMLGRAFGHAVLEVPEGQIPLARIVE